MNIDQTKRYDELKAKNEADRTEAENIELANFEKTLKTDNKDRVNQNQPTV